MDPTPKKIDDLLHEIDKLKLENDQLKSDLKASEEKNDGRLYKSIFENNISIMLLIDPTTGNILDVNQAACSFYGYAKNEIINMNMSEINILPPEQILAEMNRAANKAKNQFYFQHRLSNGEIRDVEVRSGLIEIDSKKFLSSIIYDITEKNRAIKSLEQSEKKFKQLFNNIYDGLFFFKLDKKGNPEKFLEVNEAAYSLLGYSYEEILQMSIFDISMREENEILNTINEILIKGKLAFETIYVSRDGTHIPVEINAHIFDWFGEKAILAVAKDITNRKKIRKKLKDSIEKHEKVMSFLPDAVFMIDKNKIIFANEYGANLLGYSSTKELCRKKYLSIVHPDCHKSVKKRLKQMEQDNLTVPLFEQKYLKKNGEIVDVEVTGVKIPNENGFASLVVARDISERKKVKRELNEKIEFEKLRTEFFSNISHELRTPLNVILGSLQLLELYTNEETLNENINTYKKTHKRMRQNCYRLLRIVNNIIDITRIDAGFYNVKLENYDIVSLIKNIILSVGDYVKSQGLNIQFNTNITESIIACDPEKIERAILNLLSNAIKFTEPGGTIEININSIHNEIIISIKDSGIGIPKEKIKEIFDRFVQVDKSLARKCEGSGIGLSLVKSIINMHDGKIAVSSQENQGSEFTIHLPIKKVDVKHAVKNQTTSYNSFNIERMHVELSDIYLSN